MYALPPGVSRDESRVTGLPCPECWGMLGVRAHGHHASLFFECRVGHTFDLPELLAAKEDGLEQKLWAAATALTELAALMGELEARARSAAEATAYRDRASQARMQADGVMRIVQASRPIDLSAVAPGVRRSEDDLHGGGGAAVGEAPGS